MGAIGRPSSTNDPTRERGFSFEKAQYNTIKFYNNIIGVTVTVTITITITVACNSLPPTANPNAES